MLHAVNVLKYIWYSEVQVVDVIDPWAREAPNATHYFVVYTD
jgi:hypothetical protein